MCMFCVAIPTAAAIGSAAHAKQKKQEAEQTETAQPQKFMLPASAVTTLVIAGLVTGSAWYHTQFNG